MNIPPLKYKLGLCLYLIHMIDQAFLQTDSALLISMKSYLKKPQKSLSNLELTNLKTSKDISNNSKDIKYKR